MKRPLLLLPLLALALPALAQDPATNAPATPLVMRHHAVLPTIDQACTLHPLKTVVPAPDTDCGWGAAGNPEEPIDFDEWIKSYASLRGVEWPEGSSAHYVPAFGRIEVFNTEENQARFAEVVRPFGAFQFRVRTRHVSVAPAAFEELGLDEIVGGALSPDEWAALRKRLAAHPGVEMRSCQSVLAQTGVQVTDKGVVECIYPTELAFRTGAADATNAPAAILPCNFQTRETGCILSVTPLISSDHQRLFLDFVASIVFPPEWRDFPAAPLSPGTVAAALPQPFFPVFSVSTSLDVKPGNTVALGGALLAEPGKGERHQLLFVRAEVVDLDGRPLVLP
jgi:hypothetical protein